jgi:hypothetical protein
MSATVSAAASPNRSPVNPSSNTSAPCSLAAAARPPDLSRGQIPLFDLVETGQLQLGRRVDGQPGGADARPLK